MTDPEHRTRTIRDSIMEALREGSLTAQELSARVSVQEREIAEHLRHIEASVRHGKERLITLQARCIQCGFVFENRERKSKPSRCPRCKSERIEPPRFAVRAS